MEANIGLGIDAPASGTSVRSPLARDERLAWLVGKGSERAFAALYHRYHQQLYRYCRSMLRDDADAQDALQSTFTGAFAALREGRRDAPLRPWLYRIAHNESISILRRRRPHSELPDALVAREAAIHEQAENNERLAHLVADLRELPERQRAALLMRELSGLSHEDIAVALSSTVGTAKQTIYEARRALAEFEEGRMASCDEICRTISNGDRRALRARKIRAHLRECSACSAFAAAIPTRTADLRALVPALPPAVTALLLKRALASSVAHGGGGGGGAAGAGAAGKATLALSGAKVATTVAIAATATFGAATVLRPHAAGAGAHGHSSTVKALIRGSSASPSVAGATASPGRAGTIRRGAGGSSEAPAGRAAANRARAGSMSSTTLPGRHPGSHRTTTTGGSRPASVPAGSSPAYAPGSSAASPADGSFSHGHGRSHSQGADRGASAGGHPPPQAAHGQAHRGNGNSGGGGSIHSAANAHHSNPVAQLHIPNPVAAAHRPVTPGATPGAAAEKPSVVSQAKSHGTKS
jgi:RNA polymerase sigma factor (sigma-70 family)